MLDCTTVNLMILICFVVLSKPVIFPCEYFASKMEYCVLVFQGYIGRTNQLSNTVKKSISNTVVCNHITMGTTPLSYVQV